MAVVSIALLYTAGVAYGVRIDPLGRWVEMTALVLIGILPLAAAAFLVWIVAKATMSAPASQRWSLLGILAAGVVLMLIARLGLRSSFFQIPRESAPSLPEMRRD